MFESARKISNFAMALSLVMTLGDAQAEPLTVAVAANLKYAFDDVAQAFKKESGIEVQGAFGSTGKLAAQIKNGAPFDLFLAADTEATEMLSKEGLTVGAPKVYARGVLVLWTTKSLDLKRGLPLLADDKVQKIAIANPKTAPYGRAAIETLDLAGLTKTVQPKLVYGESIAQTTQFVDSGAADIGFIAKSIVTAPEMSGKGHWVEVPKSTHQPIDQGAVIIKRGDGKQIEAAKRFFDFLFGPKAKAIFSQFGYLVP